MIDEGLRKLYNEVKEKDVEVYNFLIKYREGYIWGLDDLGNLRYMVNSKGVGDSLSYEELKKYLNYEKKIDKLNVCSADVINIFNYEEKFDELRSYGVEWGKKDLKRFKELLKEGKVWELGEFEEVGLGDNSGGDQIVVFLNEEGFMYRSLL